MRPERSNLILNRKALPLLAILLLAFLLRCYNLTAIPIWSDEAFSVALIRYPVREMLSRLMRDVHPPLYYFLLAGWTHVFGLSVLSLRSLSLLFGVAAVWAGFIFVEEAFGRVDLALGAALLLALQPFQIRYVTEARMYTLGGFLILLLSWLVLRAIRLQMPWPWFWVALVTSAAWYTHYYLLFSTLALAIYALIALWRQYGNFRAYRYCVGCYLLVLLFYAPWWRTLFSQISQVQQSYWIPPLILWSVPLTNYLLLTGIASNPATRLEQVPILLGAVFSLWLVFRIARRYQDFSRWLVQLALILPFSIAVAVSVKQSVYSNRYFLFTSLFYSVALALFIFSFRSRHVIQSLLAIAAFASLAVWVRYWRDLDIWHHQGIAQVSRYVNQHAQPPDVILVQSPFQFLNFKYYNQTAIRPRLFFGNPPARRLEQMAHYAGTAALTQDDLLLFPLITLAPGLHVWIIWSQDFNEMAPAVPVGWSHDAANSFVVEDVRPHLHTKIHLDHYTVK